MSKLLSRDKSYSGESYDFNHLSMRDVRELGISTSMAVGIPAAGLVGFLAIGSILATGSFDIIHDDHPSEAQHAMAAEAHHSTANQAGTLALLAQKHNGEFTFSPLQIKP